VFRELGEIPGGVEIPVEHQPAFVVIATEGPLVETQRGSCRTTGRAGLARCEERGGFD
jgi:hypothetical protein